MEYELTPREHTIAREIVSEEFKGRIGRHYPKPATYRQMNRSQVYKVAAEAIRRANEGRAPAIDEDEADDACDHGVSHDDHHGCGECAAERADFMLDQAKEGGP